jgi:hypothetical protein
MLAILIAMTLALVTFTSLFTYSNRVLKIS